MYSGEGLHYPSQRRLYGYKFWSVAINDVEAGPHHDTFLALFLYTSYTSSTLSSFLIDVWLLTCARGLDFPREVQRPHLGCVSSASSEERGSTLTVDDSVCRARTQSPYKKLTRHFHLLVVTSSHGAGLLLYRYSEYKKLIDCSLLNIVNNVLRLPQPQQAITINIILNKTIGDGSFSVCLAPASD